MAVVAGACDVVVAVVVVKGVVVSFIGVSVVIVGGFEVTNDEKSPLKRLAKKAMLNTGAILSKNLSSTSSILLLKLSSE